MAYSARLTDIIGTIRTLANEDTVNFVGDTMILSFVNHGLREIARSGYFKAEVGIDVEIGVSSYNLGLEISSLVDVLNIRWTGLDGNNVALEPCRTLAEFRELAAVDTMASGPEYYYVDGNTLYIWPAPNFDIDEGIQVYYTYMPAELTALPNPWNSLTDPDPSLPPIPRAYDDILTYFALYRFFARDMTSPDSLRMGTHYRTEFDRLLSGLNYQTASPALAATPYR